MRCVPRRALPWLTVLLLAAACAAAGSKGPGGPAADRITHEEIAGVQGVRNLYEVVERLRPRWLNVRASDRLGLNRGIVVYQDQTFLGDADILRQFPPDMFYELRHLDGAVASATLPGLHPEHPVAGAIILYTNERGR